MTSPEFEAWWKTTNLAERRDAWQGWQANEARHADLLAALEAARAEFSSIGDIVQIDTRVLAQIDDALAKARAS